MLKGCRAGQKSIGSDKVPSKLFKEKGVSVVDWMYKICVNLGNQIEELKKGDLKPRGNYRTIVLVSGANKVRLRIIPERIHVKTETKIADEQAGFRQGKGTKYKVTNLV